MPKTPHRLPREWLTDSETEKVLSQPDTNTALGVRDRAILEVLYSTGNRRTSFLLVTRGGDNSTGVPKQYGEPDFS